MINKDTLLVGSDFELPLFLRDGTPFPVTGLLGGTKRAPKPLEKLGKGFYVQEDNVNAEFNIPPAKTPKEFTGNILKVLGALPRILPPTVTFKYAAATEYKAELLDHHQAKVFGCDPDYNAYSGEENPRPYSKNQLLRTASGHVHVGWENPTQEERVALVKMLDVVSGVYFIGADDERRRQLYGKAGSYRPKEYGCEYRVLGNSWLQDPSLVYGHVIQAVDLVNNGATLTREEEQAVQEAINTDKYTKEVEVIRKRLLTSLNKAKVKKTLVQADEEWVSYKLGA